MDEQKRPAHTVWLVADELLAIWQRDGFLRSADGKHRIDIVRTEENPDGSLTPVLHESFIEPEVEPDTLDKAWKVAEQVVTHWGEGAMFVDLTLMWGRGDHSYTALVERTEHREPNGPPAVRQEVEESGETPQEALRKVIAVCEGWRWGLPLEPES